MGELSVVGLPKPEVRFPHSVEWLLSEGLNLVKNPGAERDRLLRWVDTPVDRDKYIITRTTRRGQDAFLKALGEDDIQTTVFHPLGNGYIGSLFLVDSRPGVYLLEYWKDKRLRASRRSIFLVKVGEDLISEMDKRSGATFVRKQKGEFARNTLKPRE